ncbi:hypothetical protein M413DRAFT_445925 [Hebeloma cylindrosporum]|uniref:YDG domain-containing protein n=1 Tax=Hebeloma cylindrosporum TaxID=76867 RepID=A0A0C3C8B6_HEBCY|nr:hypothetical protein M413DRAFT_445925 [Hebeloma cylindrosporum h7]
MSGVLKGSVMNAREGRNPFQFGEITGFPVGSRWKYRRDLCNDGVHAPTRGGIHGRSQVGTYSLVLSGGYEDDVDLGNELWVNLRSFHKL